MVEIKSIREGTESMSKRGVNIQRVPVRFIAPKKLNNKNVIYWSESYKRLEGVKEGSAIRTKAKRFLRLKCIVYNPETKEYLCKPIPGYNKTTYRMKKEGDHFSCSCQFYNKVSKFWVHPICSHTLTLKMYLKIKHWNGG